MKLVLEKRLRVRADYVLCVSWSPDSTRLAAGFACPGDGPNVIEWNTTDWKRSGQWASGHQPYAIAYSPRQKVADCTARRIYAVDNSHHISSLEGRTRIALSYSFTDQLALQPIRLLPDLSLEQERPPEVNGKYASEWHLEYIVQNIVPFIAPDGSEHLLLGYRLPRSEIPELPNLRQAILLAEASGVGLSAVTLDADGLTDLAVSTDNSRVAVSTINGPAFWLCYLNAERSELSEAVATGQAPSPTKSLAFSATSSAIFTGHAAGQLVKWEKSAPIAQLQLAASGRGAGCVRSSPNAPRVAVADSAGLSLIDEDSMLLLDFVPDAAGFDALEWSRDGKRIAATKFDNSEVHVFHIQD